MKRVKSIEVFFLFLCIPTFILGLIFFHEDVLMRLFGELMTLYLTELVRKFTIIYLIFLCWSLLSIPIGLGLIIFKILQKYWLSSVILLIATIMNGMLIIDFMTAWYGFSRAW